MGKIYPTIPNEHVPKKMNMYVQKTTSSNEGKI